MLLNWFSNYCPSTEKRKKAWMCHKVAPVCISEGNDFIYSNTMNTPTHSPTLGISILSCVGKALASSHLLCWSFMRLLFMNEYFTPLVFHVASFVNEYFTPLILKYLNSHNMLQGNFHDIEIYLAICM